MALTKSAARTKVRQRIRDTVATYEYSDTLLDTYLAPALKEIAVAVRDVDPDFYLRSRITTGYTDALDPAPSGQQGFEFYSLAPNFMSLRWLERFDNGIVQYEIPSCSARDQELNRYGFGRPTRIAVTGGSTYTRSWAGGRETVSVHGAKFRIVPPPTATGPVWRMWFNADPEVATGEAENLDIPSAFEEALIRVWAFAPVSDDGSPIAAPMQGHVQNEIAKAKKAHGSRSRKTITLGRVW